MSNISDIIASYPTGRWRIQNSTAIPNKIQNNVKTSDQVAAERNKKINQNEYICQNIEVDDKENFMNKKIEHFEGSKCVVRSNNSIFFIFIIFSLIILIFLFILYTFFFK